MWRWGRPAEHYRVQSLSEQIAGYEVVCSDKG